MLERVYVLDTVALIRYLADDANLGGKAKRIFEAAENGETQLVLSVISLAEFYYWNAKPKNQIVDDFDDVYQKLKTNPAFQLVPFTPEEVSEFVNDEAVPEMHDRIIVGLARRLGAPLVTSDVEIEKSGVVRTEW